MGCFNETCGISNLPICAGDPVYLLLLTETPYEDKKGRPGCYLNDHWFLRTLPLLGEYNDYGSIEKWESGWVEDLIVKQFHKDLQERDQSDRDKTLGILPPKKENLNIANLLDWLREGKLKVQRESYGSGLTELAVAQVLVRKDVWDSLLNMASEEYREYSMDTMKKDVKKYVQLLKELKKQREEIKKSENQDLLIRFYSISSAMQRVWTDNTFIAPFVANPRPGPPGSNSIDFFKDCIDEKFLNGEISDQEAEAKFEVIGEVLHVQSMMGFLRKSWNLTTGSGSQNQDFDMSMQFNLSVAAIAYKKMLTNLSEQMGFAEEDFERAQKENKGMSKKRMKEFLDELKEVQKQKEQIQSIPKEFVEQLRNIDAQIEKHRDDQ